MCVCVCVCLWWCRRWEGRLGCVCVWGGGWELLPSPLLLLREEEEEEVGFVCVFVGGACDCGYL